MECSVVVTDGGAEAAIYEGEKRVRASGWWVLGPQASAPKPHIARGYCTVQYVGRAGRVRALGTVYGYQLRARYTINPSTPYTTKA